MIDWVSDDTFTVGETTFICDQFGLRIGSEHTKFCLLKIPYGVKRYAELLSVLEPKTIVEVGIMEGASVAFFAEFARPRKIVGIDIDSPTQKLLDFIERRRLDDIVSVYGGIDQADGEALNRIIDADIGGLVDLVVDDASHEVGPTRATFNHLFSRVRPGGYYVLEDWATGLKAGAAEPLVTVVHEILAAKATRRGVFGDITVTPGWVVVERGPAPFDSL